MSPDALDFTLAAMASRLPRLAVLEPPPSARPADWRGWRVRPSSDIAPFLRNRLRQLIAPAALESERSCPLETYVAETTCLAYAAALAARDRVPEGRSGLSGLTLARLVAERIVAERMAGTPAEDPEPEERGPALLAARREDLLAARPPDLVLREIHHGLPFGLSSQPTLLLRLRSLGARQGKAPLYAVRESVGLEEPWFAPLARRALASGNGPYRDSPTLARDRRFAARLDRGEVVRGAGAHASFTVRRDGKGATVVAHDLPGPFLQEIGSGVYILWERPLLVHVCLRDDEEIRAPMEYLQALHVRAAERACGMPRTGPVSRLDMHAHVESSSLRICMAGTFAACRRLAGGDPVHNLLHSKLVAAGRVLRHGWKRSNSNQPFHDYRGVLRSCASDGKVVPYVLLDEAEAKRYVRAHPGTELVGYAR